MNYQDILQTQSEQRLLQLPFTISRRRETKGYISINDLVAIPVENVASFFDRAVDLPLHKKDTTEIGYLYFTKGIEVTNLNTLSEAKFICYLIDIPDRSIIVNSLSHSFSTDYVIIYRQFLEEYLKDCSSSAPIWGHFNHKYPTLTIPPPKKKNITELIVDSYPKFSKDHFFESSVRGIRHTLAFERYLKYYHLLELNFDFDVIERIRSLDPSTDSKSISMLLHEYKKEDIERLKYLFITYCTDIPSIVDKLNSIGSYLPTAKEIFYDFAKESNPLKDYNALTSVIGKAGGFTMANCKTAKINQANEVENYNKFICSLSAFWIYRVRNSIAHKKIGEFIMTYNEEDFVLNFAEPLLITILKQVFK